MEVRRDPQHIPLAAVFAELAQFGAAAIDLVAAQEVDPGAVSEGLGADIDGQLPLVRNTKSSGRPMTRDFTGSSMCSAGIHWRAPISACPVASRAYDRCTTVIPFA